MLEVWVGMVELRQLPGEDHSITLAGKGAFTWIACWASSTQTYRARVEEVEATYGLFVVGVERAMPFTIAEEAGTIDEELADIRERTRGSQNYCIFGTFHIYPSDN